MDKLEIDNKPNRHQSTECMSQNKIGKYVPAIPRPFYGLKMRCHCGASFWKEEAYDGHYALKHILHM